MIFFCRGAWGTGNLFGGEQTGEPSCFIGCTRKGIFSFIDLLQIKHDFFVGEVPRGTVIFFCVWGGGGTCTEEPCCFIHTYKLYLNTYK